MKLNTAKQKMLRGEPAFGYSAKLGSPVAAEFLSQCGVDFVLIDGQHGCWGPDSAIQGITAVCAGAAMPMARVATLERRANRSIMLLLCGAAVTRPVIGQIARYQPVVK